MSEEVFKPDLHNLDKEWVRLPDRIYAAAMALADRKADNDRAKAERDLTEAELDKELRSEFERLQLKVTEKIVENAVVRHKRMRAAVEQAIEAKHDEDVAKAKLDSLYVLKSALENGVDLHGMAYFARMRTDEKNYENTKRMERDAAFGKKRRADD